MTQDRGIEASKSVNDARSGELGELLVANMASITRDRISDMALANARANQPFLDRGRSIRELRGDYETNLQCAVVIAAGPSLRKNNVADVLKKERFSGSIIATESSLRYCLENEIIPSLVVTLDPHPKRIVRWFGDPNLSPRDLAEDDYFSRQDMDSAFSNEMRANSEILELLHRYGRNIRIALSTSASTAVVGRALDSGMQIYWWNPMLDDPDVPGSVTAELQRTNCLPCINAGGNVGAACWMIADAVLGIRHVALTGVDFSYYADTPYARTQYYKEAVALVGEENLDSVFMKVFNPILNEWFYTDPAYMWYRRAFLEMVQDAECRTYNCTEGGIVFGEGIEFVPLRQFIAKMNSGSA